jgi:hypothetical protein
MRKQSSKSYLKKSTLQIQFILSWALIATSYEPGFFIWTEAGTCAIISAETI